MYPGRLLRSRASTFSVMLAGIAVWAGAARGQTIAALDGSDCFGITASADGTVVLLADVGGSFPVRWSVAQGMQWLNPPFTVHSVLRMSADGSTVVTASNTQLWRWTVTQGWTMGPSGVGLEPKAVSNDGKVVGEVEANGSWPPDYAFLWDPSVGLVNLNTYLPTLGINLTGWTLQSAADISDNGRTITGLGALGSNPQAGWVVTLPPPPLCTIEIMQHPQSAAVAAGASAVFSVGASSSQALAYQWRRNGVNLADGPTGNGSTVAGSASATMTISAASLADNGAAFDCIVTNGCGTLRSDPAGLGVTAACWPNCDQSTTAPVLNVADFTCFLQQFAAGCP